MASASTSAAHAAQPAAQTLLGRKITGAGGGASNVRPYSRHSGQEKGGLRMSKLPHYVSYRAGNNLRKVI